MNHAALRRGSASALVLLLSPALGHAQAVAIDHKEIGCLVAEKYPAVDACFSPANELQRARLYFRPQGTTSWYYVDNWAHRTPRAQATCMETTLPRPKKSMVNKRVEYYLEAVGKGLAESQSPRFSSLVVENEKACAKDKKAAAVLPSAIGNVLPALPPGFVGTAGGGALGTVAAVVGAGALGGAIGAVASDGGGGGAALPTTPAPTTTAPPATTAPTTTTTTFTPAAFNPVFKVFRGSVIENGNLVLGSEPLELRFVMCESTGPFRLRYGLFINGSLIAAKCDSLVTFNAGGFVATSVGQVGRSGLALPGPTHNVRMHLQSDGPGNNPKDERNLVVDLSGSSSTTTTTTTTTLPGCIPGDVTGPVVNLTSPVPPKRYPVPDGATIPFAATATDAASGVARVEFKFSVNQASPPFSGTASVGTDPTAPYSASWSQTDFQKFLGTVCEAAGEAQAVAFDNCGNSSKSGQYPIIIHLSVVCPPTTLAAPGRPPRLPDDEPTALGHERAFVSQLEMAGARGQVVPNGSQVLFTERGRALLRARFVPGENRVEATLVSTEGRPGTWRFDLSTLTGLETGSLRVIAGEVAQVAGDEVIFRLKGKAGERVVFAFRIP